MIVAKLRAQVGNLHTAGTTQNCSALAGGTRQQVDTWKATPTHCVQGDSQNQTHSTTAYQRLHTHGQLHSGVSRGV
jgi:hypothetical protein